MFTIKHCGLFSVTVKKSKLTLGLAVFSGVQCTQSREQRLKIKVVIKTVAAVTPPAMFSLRFCPVTLSDNMQCQYYCAN